MGNIEFISSNPTWALDILCIILWITSAIGVINFLNFRINKRKELKHDRLYVATWFITIVVTLISIVNEIFP